jgi:hypothetical protein
LPFFFTIVQSFLQNKKIYRADCRCDITWGGLDGCLSRTWMLPDSWRGELGRTVDGGGVEWRVKGKWNGTPAGTSRFGGSGRLTTGTRREEGEAFASFFLDM